jgi:hypothetical protein
MQHAQGFAIGGLQFAAPEALVLPDGLQQFLRRRGPAVAKDVDGAATLTPDGVKVFHAEVHTGVFCAIVAQSQADKIITVPSDEIEADLILNATKRFLACLMSGDPKFLFAAAGIFRLHWQRFFTVCEVDD